MRKEEKLDIINAISAQLEETPNFYITDIAGLNAEKTHNLRKACFEAGVKLVVTKNTLFTKVLEASENLCKESVLHYYELNTCLKTCLAEFVSLAGIKSSDVSDIEVWSLLQLC